MYNISVELTIRPTANQYAADGLYCDGCAYTIFERNTVHNCDLNMEAASEHKGHNSSYVTIRNNLFYDANAVGVSIGGYASGVGGSDHVVVVNNTLYNNNTKNQGAEFQIQHHSGSAGNIFENNIVYAGTPECVDLQLRQRLDRDGQLEPVLLHRRDTSQGTSIDWGGKSNYKTYAAYQSGSGEDKNSPECQSAVRQSDVEPSESGRRVKFPGGECGQHEPDLQRRDTAERHLDLRQHRLCRQSAHERQRPDQHWSVRAMSERAGRRVDIQGSVTESQFS